MAVVQEYGVSWDPAGPGSGSPLAFVLRRVDVFLLPLRGWHVGRGVDRGAVRVRPGSR